MIKFNKKFWFWLLIAFLFIANIPFTYFGRKYYPASFNPQKISFIENYCCSLAGLRIFLLVLFVIFALILMIIFFIKETFKPNEQ